MHPHSYVAKRTLHTVMYLSLLKNCRFLLGFVGSHPLIVFLFVVATRQVTIGPRG